LICCDTDGNGPQSVGDDISDRKPILQSYGSYGGVTATSGGDMIPTTAAASMTNQAERSRAAATSAGAPSDDEVSN